MTTGRGLGWLAALAGVAVIGAATPDPAADHRVSWTATVVGVAAATDRIAVAVESIDVGGTLAPGFGDALAPAGVVVGVDLRASALTGQVTWVVEAHSRDGRWYAERAENPEALGTTPAGFTTAGTAVFVVPAERVAGLEIAVTPAGRRPVNHTRGVLVDLGLTGRESTTGAVSPRDSRTEVTK